jgi:cobalt-zinc-cadmium efflux system outer membrane protein
MASRSRCFASLFLVIAFSLYESCVSSAQVPSPQGSLPTVSRLTLEDATRLALQHNQSLRAQRLAIDQAKANEITAALKPNPVFTNLNEDFPLLSPSYLTLDNLRTNQEFTDSVAYTIERGGKRLKRVQVAQDTTDVTVKTVADNERQLKFQVAQAFINALLAKSNLEFAREDLKNFLQVVEINQQRMKAGDIAEADYLKIKLQQLQFEQDVSAAQIALVQGEAALRQLVGYDTVPEDFDLVGDLQHSRYAATQKDLENEALLSRPDYLAAQSAVKLANDTVTLAYGNRARDLTVESEYKRSGPVNGLGFGLSIEIPIHDRNQGEIARSKAAASQALESAEAVRVGVLTDVRSAYTGYQTAEEVASLYESGYLNQAEQSRDISNYAYQRGAATLLDMLDAERSYRATQLAYRQALAAYMTSTEQINFVVGKKVMP